MSATSASALSRVRFQAWAGALVLLVGAGLMIRTFQGATQALRYADEIVIPCAPSPIEMVCGVPISMSAAE